MAKVQRKWMTLRILLGSRNSNLSGNRFKLNLGKFLFVEENVKI
jgi:hypothetical protein